MIRIDKIKDGLYRTEAMDSGRMAVQVIGNGTLSVWVSVDGKAYSQFKAMSVVGSIIFLIDLPEGGKIYLQYAACNEPIIHILR
jgi:hypothetical protein